MQAFALHTDEKGSLSLHVAASAGKSGRRLRRIGRDISENKAL